MGLKRLYACAAVVVAVAVAAAAGPGAAAPATTTGALLVGQLRLAGCPEGETAWTRKVAASGTRAYVLAECVSSFARMSPGDSIVYVVDAAEPARPSLLGSLRIPRTETFRLEAVGDYAYVTTGLNSWYTGYLLVVDATDPANPRLGPTIREEGWGSLFGLAAQGRYVYLAGQVSGTDPSVPTYGLTIFDMADPARPAVVGRYTWTLPEGGGPAPVAIEGSRVYVGDAPTRAIDVSDPARPRLLGVYARTGGAQMVGLAVRNQLGYFAGYSADASGRVRSKVWVVDFTDPTLPRELSSPAAEQVDGYVYGLVLAGAHALLSGAGQGVAIVDVSDPTAPRGAAPRALVGAAYHMAVAGDVVHAATASETYLLLRFPVTVWRSVLPWASQRGGP
jgi:hypothetical protein